MFNKFFTQKQQPLPDNSDDEFTLVGYNENDEDKEILSRLGSIEFSVEIIMEYPQLTKKILSNMLMLEISHDAIHKSIRYVGYSEMFEKTLANTAIAAPYYTCEIKKDEKLDYSFRVKKVFDPNFSNDIH